MSNQEITKDQLIEELENILKDIKQFDEDEINFSLFQLKMNDLLSKKPSSLEDEILQNLSKLMTEWVYIIKVSEEGKVIPLWRTEAGLRMTGYSPSELVENINIQKVTHPDDVYITHRRMEKLGKRQIAKDSYRIITKDGQEIWVNDIAIPIWDEEKDELRYICGAAHEITELKRYELELKEEKEKAQLLLDITPSIIMSLNMEGNITLLNQQGCKILGTSPKEAQGKNWFTTFLPQEDQKFFIDSYSQVTLGKKEFTGRTEQTVVTTSGEEKIIRWNSTLLHDNEGNISGILSSGEDITEQKQIEQQLEFQAVLLDQIQDYVTATDLEGRITYVNEIVCKSLGISAEELLGNHVDFYGENTSRGASQQEIIEKSLAEGQWHGEVVNYAQDGREILLDTRIQQILNESGETIGMIGISSDITEKKKAEIALRESEEQYRSLFNSARDAIFLMDLEGNYVAVNNQAIDMLGYTEEELIGISFLKTIVDDETEEAYQAIQNLIQGKTFPSYQRTMLKKNGEAIPVEISVSVTRNSEGEPQYIQSIGRDITKRLKAEEELKKSAVIIDSTIDAVLTTNTTGDITFWNRGAEKTLGYTKDEILGQHIQTLFKNQTFPRHDQMLDTLFANGDNIVMEIETTCLTKDKDEIEVLLSLSSIRDELGNVKELVGIAKDITDRKRTEEALRESEERFQSFMKHFPGSAYIKDAEDRIVYCNESFAAITGNTATDLIGKTTEEYTLPELVAKFKEENKLVLSQNQPMSFEHTFPTPAGTSYWLTYKFPIPKANNLADIGTISFDNTDRRNAEQALQESQRQLATLMKHLPGMAYRCKNNRDWTMEVVSEGCYALTGYQAEDFINSKNQVYGDIIHPDDRERIWEEVQKAVKKQEYYQFTFRIRTADGKQRWVWEQGQGVFNEQNELIALEGFLLNITERVQAEQALFESEQRYANLFKNTLTALFVMNDDGQIIEANQAASELLEIPLDTLIDSNIYSLIPEEYYEGISNLWQTFLETEQMEGEFELPLSNASTIYLEYFAVTNAAPGQHLLSIKDITERKKANQALQQSEIRYSSLFNSSLDAILLFNEDDRLIDANPALFNLLGYSKEELLDMTVEDIIYLEDRELSLEIWREYIESGNHSGELQLIDKNKNIFDVEYRAVANILPGIHFASMHNITERKKAENELRQSEEKYRLLFENAPIGIFKTTPHGEIYQNDPSNINPMFASMLGFKTPDELVRQVNNISESYVDPIRREEFKQQIVEHGAVQGFEIELYEHISHTPISLAVFARGVTDENNEVLYYDGFVIDVTEQKKAEIALRQSEEKYRMLFETAPVGIFKSTPDGKLYCDPLPNINPVLLEMLGFETAEELVIHRAENSQDYLNLSHKETMLKQLTTQDSIKGMEIKLLKKDNTPIWFSMNMKAVADQNDNILYFDCFVNDISERKRAERIIKANEERLKLLTQRLFTVQEDERKQLARDLHDEAGQALSVVKIYLNMTEDKAKKEYPDLLPDIEKLKTALNTAHEELRDLAVALRPTALDSLGLPTAVEKLCQRIAENSNIHFDVYTEEIPDLSDQAAIALFRITQESLNNVMRHSHAQNVSVYVGHRNNHVEVTLRDDGKGFDTKKLEDRYTGLGILGMKERMDGVEGSLEITSTPGEGTTVTAIYPQENDTLAV